VVELVLRKEGISAFSLVRGLPQPLLAPRGFALALASGLVVGLLVSSGLVVQTGSEGRARALSLCMRLIRMHSLTHSLSQCCCATVE
jgi:hypothetical protein